MDEFISQLRTNDALVSDDSVEVRKGELSRFPQDVQNLALEILEIAEAKTLE